MKSNAVTKTGPDFSLSELPEDYPYRYTLYYILTELHGKKQARQLKEQICKRLDIGVEMLRKYIYVKKMAKGNIMSEEKIVATCEVMGIDRADLIAPNELKKAS